MKKENILLLVGGISPEREVSKSSGENVYNALLKLDYNVTIIDPAYGENQPKDNLQFFCDKDFAPISRENYIKAINLPAFENTDLVFNSLHGKYGEDGTIQSLLELKNIKYTGSGVLSSSLTMDKCASKILFQHFDVSTPKWFFVSEDSVDFNEIKETIKTNLLYPCVIKPNDQGSTIGLSICHNQDEVIPAIKLALQFSSKALIEEFIEGFELTVGVLDNIVLPPLEIKPKKDCYDYECKYTDGMSEYVVPANFPEEVLNNLKEQAKLAFDALGCSSYARIDFRVNRKHQIFCLEANTLPGMTSHSLLPKMAMAAGISFEKLIEKIIIYALK
ncbi:MAG: D-alanine--D-alanine ligase [bacterium]